MKKQAWRLFCCMLFMVLGVTCSWFVLKVSADTNTMSMEEATEGGSFEGSVKIDGTPLSEIDKAEYGQEIEVELKWSFADDKVITVDDQLVYDLPDEVRFTQTSGRVKNDEGNNIGTYTISDHQVIIQYDNQNFLDGRSRKGKLTFSGTLDGEDISKKEPTDVEILFEGIGTFEIQIQPEKKPAVVSVAKRFEDYTPQDHIYDCYITITAQGENTDVLVSDEMYPGMVLYGASPKIYTDADCTKEYRGAYTGFDETAGTRTLNATIAKMEDNQVLYVKYQVQVEPDLYVTTKVEDYFANLGGDYEKYYNSCYSGKVPNCVDVSSTEDTTPQRAWADVYTLRYTFQKFNNEKDNRPKEGLLSWQFVINTIASDITSGWILDRIPANCTMVKDWNEMKIFRSNGEELTPISDYISIEEKVKDDGSTEVKVVFTDEMLAQLRNNELYVQYFIKVEKQTEDTVWYSNYAEIFFNGTSYGTTGDEMKYTKPDELAKTVKYDATTAPNAQYRVEVNPAGLDLYEGSDVLVLKDTMGSALDLDVSSIRVNGQPVATEDLTFDPENHTFTIRLEDKKAYVITYNAVVNLKVGETLDAENAANKCELVGVVTKGGENPTVISAKVYTSAASSSSDREGDFVALEIIKHDETSVLDVLAGATFKVDAIALRENTVASVTAVKEAEVTDSDGKMTVNQLTRDTVYCLTETQAPEGYTLDATPRYFVFKSNDTKIYPEKIVVGDKEYPLSVIDSSKATETVYWSNKKKSTSDDRTEDDSTAGSPNQTGNVTTSEENPNQNPEKNTTVAIDTPDSNANEKTTQSNTSSVTTPKTESTTQVSTDAQDSTQNEKTTEKTTESSSKKKSAKRSKSDIRKSRIKKIAQTGDHSPVGVCVIVLLIAIGLECLLLITRDKNRS